MSYSVSKLTTVAECDKATALATERKTDLQFEQTVSGKDLTDQEKVVQQTTINLITVKAEITGTEAAIAGMPAGEQKENYLDKLRRLNDRKDNFEERLRKGGAAALLDTELDAALLVAQITEIDAYLAAITAHKATL
jgi:hypothetical protein